MKRKIYFIRDREKIRLKVANKGFHWLSASALGIFTLFCFLFPFLVLWFTGGPIGFGFIITILIFGGTGFYSLRLFLWNIAGKEVFEVSNGQIMHYYDYGIFKDNFKKLKHKKFFFCYTTANEPNEILRFEEYAKPNETKTFFPAFMKNKELVLSNVPISADELLVFREFGKEFMDQ